jgi:hypothetical protein
MPQPDTDSSYERWQDIANKAYSEEYKQWVASLLPTERARLRKAGLIEPLTGYHVGGHSPDSKGDIAESSRASCVDPEINDSPESSSDDTITAQEAISRIVAFLIAAPNVKIAAYALAFAANLNALNGLGTQGEAAQKLLVSPTILSRRIEEARLLLNLPRSSHQKGDAARESAKRATSTNHWRKRKVKKAPSKEANTQT